MATSRIYLFRKNTVRLGWGNSARKRPRGGQNRRPGRRKRRFWEQLNANSEQLNATMCRQGTVLVAFTLTSHRKRSRTLINSLSHCSAQHAMYPRRLGAWRTGVFRNYSVTQERVLPIADTPHSDALYTGTVRIHRSTPLPHRSEVKSPQFPKPSDPRFQMRFLCVRNFIPNENRKLKQYTAYNLRHNTHQLHSLFNPT